MSVDETFALPNSINDAYNTAIQQTHPDCRGTTEMTVHACWTKGNQKAKHFPKQLNETHVSK